MSIATDSAQRRQWLARLAHVQNELVDLQREIDIALRSKIPFGTMKALVRGDVHIERARAELDTALGEVGGIQ